MAGRLQSRNGSSRRRSSGLLGPALIAAAIVFATYRFSHSPAPAPVASGIAPIVAAFDTVDIPVAAEPVPAGTKVKDIRFRTVTYPRHQVPVGALTTIAGIADGMSTVALPAQLPLFEVNFVRGGQGVNAVTERIPPGMRAMTVKVDATTAVEGWAGSGSIVDVLLIGKERTSVIAERVKILSAERVVSPVEGTSAPHVPSTVTLLVTQEQCLAINTAIPLGRIAFALRSAKDDENWANTAFTAERLKGKSNASIEQRNAINGFLSISGAGGRKGFALSDGKWVETEIVPEGFRVLDKAVKNVEVAAAR